MSMRARARVTGVLFIIATVVVLLGGAIADPAVKGSSYLTRASMDDGEVMAGALFLIVAAFACAGIAISLYPLLRRYGHGLALGSVCFRLIETILYLVGAIAALLLVTLSQQFVKAADPISPHFQTVGTLLHAVRDRAGLIGSMAFYVGALMYYYLFIRSRLLPRWLSVWGLVAAAIGLAAAVLVLLEAIGYMSATHIAFNMPIAVQEMVLAVWLIVRGYSSPAAGVVLDENALIPADAVRVPVSAR